MRLIFFIAFFSLSHFIGFAQNDRTEGPEKIKLLVITGGQAVRNHIDLVPTSFYSLFEAHENIDWTHASWDEAAFQTAELDTYDALLFYNRSDTLSVGSQENLKNYLNSGKGMIVLHHALGSYNNWEWWWKEVVGGKYQMQATTEFPQSTFNQDEIIKIRSTVSHPITDEVGDFTYTDETYGKLWISDKAKVLYETDHELSDGPVVWVSPFEKSRVLVIQPGHASPVHRDRNYQKLIYQSLLWVIDQ